jgi:hypothetical protein
LYSHPIHLAINYPGVTDPIATRNMLQNFLDWAQQMPNVWIVNNQQVCTESSDLVRRVDFTHSERFSRTDARMDQEPGAE